MYYKRVDLVTYTHITVIGVQIRLEFYSILETKYFKHIRMRYRLVCIVTPFVIDRHEIGTNPTQK